MFRKKYFELCLGSVIGIILSWAILFGVLTKAQLGPGVEEMYQEAKNAYYAGEHGGAIKKYREILDIEPQSRASLQLASIYEEMGDYSKAINYYEQYLKYNPLSQQAKLDLAIARFNCENIYGARKDLLNLLTLQSIDPIFEREAAYYLSKIYLQTDQLSLALQYADRALEVDPKFAVAAIQKGLIMEVSGNSDEAIKNYLLGLKIDGSLKGVQKRLGLLYLKKEDFDQAYYRFDLALNENKNDETSQTKLKWLEEKFPGKYKRSSTPPRPKDFPKSVNFEHIIPFSEDLNIDTIKIGLAGGEPQKVVIFRVGSDFVVKDQKGVVLGEGKTGEIWFAEVGNESNQLARYPDGKKIQFGGTIRIEPKESVPILIHQVQFGEGYYWSGKQDRQYRGILEIIPQKAGLIVVNLVKIEEYLYSVVASEMPSSWPLEALKAQAIAARTYTNYNLKKHRAQGFDLCDSVHCAAYNGITWETDNTRKAVNETLGEIMTYNGKPINAVYSANSGGHTEDVKDVWGFDLPYLKGVSTLKDNTEGFPLEPAALKEWLRRKPDAYSSDPRYANLVHYRWQRRVSRSFIEDSLGIGTLKELKITGRGKGGSVISMIASGDKGTVELKHTLRSKLGGLRSNRFFFRPEYEKGQLTGFVFYGGGWGHSTGMDQVAAAGMARSGINYDEILKHFYTGIELEKQY